MTFGRIVAQACKREKISHGELARRLGVAQSRVPEILKSRNIEEKTLRACASALGLDVDVKLRRRR